MLVILDIFFILEILIFIICVCYNFRLTPNIHDLVGGVLIPIVIALLGAPATPPSEGNALLLLVPVPAGLPIPVPSGSIPYPSLTNGEYTIKGFCACR
jgi:hypothetical protein